MGSRLVLVRRDPAGVEYPAIDPWPETVVEVHPPIPDVLPELRAAELDDVRADGPMQWWHRQHGCWGALRALHTAGRHEDAAMLGRLLAWCDQQGDPRSAGSIVWEIRHADGEVTHG